MAYTLANLQDDIRNYTEVDDGVFTAGVLNTIIKNAENKILIADIGHYEGEICTQQLIYDYLNKKITTFTLHFSEVNTNPINYL